MTLLAILSILWSPLPLATGRSALQLGLTVGLALLVVNAVTPRRFIACLWVVMGIILVLSIIVNNKHYDGLAHRVTMAGIYNNKNSLSVAGASFAVASTAIFLHRPFPLPLRFIALFGIVFGAALNVLAYSVGRVFAMVLAIAIVASVSSACFLPRRWRPSYINLLILCGAGAALILLPTVLMFSAEILALVGKDATLTGRTLLWFFADRMSDDYFPLGIGYQAFWKQGHSPAEFLWKVMHVASRSGFHFHNLYYDMLIQLGYPGIVLGLIMIAYALITVLGWVRRDPNEISGFFLGCLMMIVVTQWQEIGLFSLFDLTCFYFVICMGYAAKARRQDVRSQRLRAVLALDPDNGLIRRQVLRAS
ncbi:O-antigen ligase family protein [Dankookia sp. P2]|uniref:O-antigen ligase family protein n=1 Tax=Dankookia sp. P2 TaxID=3423955 RepID=UPI003D6686D7